MRIKRRKRKKINNMLSFNIWVLIFLFTTSCNNPSKDKNEKGESVKITVDSLFDCDSLKAKLPQIVLSKYSVKNIDVDHLKSVDSAFVNKHLPGFTDSDVYFFSSSNVSDCSIIFYSELVADQITKSLTLVVFDQTGKVESNILLAKYTPYPDGEANVESSIRDNKLFLCKIEKSIGDFDKSTNSYTEVVDSVNMSFEIDKQFKLKQISKDSLRIIH